MLRDNKFIHSFISEDSTNCWDHGRSVRLYSRVKIICIMKCKVGDRYSTLFISFALISKHMIFIREKSLTILPWLRQRTTFSHHWINKIVVFMEWIFAFESHCPVDYVYLCTLPIPIVLSSKDKVTIFENYNKIENCIPKFSNIDTLPFDD